MSSASVRATGRGCRRCIHQEIVCSVEKWWCRSQHVIIYATEVLGRITRQTNTTRSVNRITTTKEDIRSILQLLGGHKVSFDTLLGQSMCARTTLAAMLSYIQTCLVDLLLIPTPSTINAIISLDLPLGSAISKMCLRSYPWYLPILEELNIPSTSTVGLLMTQ